VKRVGAVLALGALILLAGGCGSSKRTASPVSAQEYAHALDQICAPAASAIEKFKKALDFKGMSNRMNATADQIAKLHPPRLVAQPARDLVAKMRDEAVRVKGFEAALIAHDRKKADELASSFGYDAVDIEQDAAVIGALKCQGKPR
jgi:hypothetical protein